MTAFSLVWPSPATVWKSLSFSPVFLRNSGQICVMESAGVIATVLPLMSSGFLMFFSTKPIADIGGLGGDGLRGGGGAAAFLNLEIDILGGIDALGLAVIERRVLAIDIP